MKIRTDYVMNSSSSSFIIARKEELSENLKNAIVDFVTDQMLGEKLLTPDSTEEQIQHAFDEEYIDEEEQVMIRKALKEGKTVYNGCVVFEECEYNHAGLFEKLWEKLEEASKDEFIAIDGNHRKWERYRKRPVHGVISRIIGHWNYGALRTW